MSRAPFVPYFVTWYCHDVPRALLRSLGRGWDGLDVLEAGCGGGSLLFRLAASARSVHGVDISEGAIDFLRSEYASWCPNLTLESCDFAHFRTSTRYGVVISNDCFEHVEDGEGFVESAALALDADGVLALQFPNELTHGINHFPEVRDLEGLMSRYFGSVRIFTVHPSRWQKALRSVFARLRAAASPQLAKNRRAVLADPETQGLDDFARSSCYTWIRAEASGGLKFTAARAVNSFFRLLERVGPRHRVEEITDQPGDRSILGQRLVVVAEKPTGEQGAEG